MKKTFKILSSIALASMLLVPAVASAASPAKSGLYDMETSKYVSIKEFKLMSSQGKISLLLNANVYLVLAGTVYSAKSVIEAPTNKALKEASQTEAEFEAEKGKDLTNTGEIVTLPPVEEELQVLSIE